MKPITQKIFNLIISNNPNNFEAIALLLEHSKIYAKNPLLTDLAVTLGENFEYEGVHHSLYTLACRFGNQRVMRLLQEHGLTSDKTYGPNVQTVLWLATKHGHDSLVEFLLNPKDLYVASTTYENHTTYYSYPLTAAAEQLNYEMLVLFLGNNADVNVKATYKRDGIRILECQWKVAEDIQNKVVNGRASRTLSFLQKNSKEGVTAREILESKEDSEQKARCLKLFEVVNSLRNSVEALELEKRKAAFQKALGEDPYYVTFYLAKMVEETNAELNKIPFGFKFDKMDFLRVALKELYRACEDDSKVIKQMHPSLVEQLIPAQVREDGIFKNEEDKMKTLKGLGAHSDFRNTFFSTASNAPAAAVVSTSVVPILPVTTDVAKELSPLSPRSTM